MMQDRTDSPKARSLWLWVILAFVLLISAWTALIIISTSNQPELVELETVP